MKHLRDSRLRQQTVAKQIDVWSEPLALPVQVPTTADYLAGFLRAVVQTFSPSTVREFFRELDRNAPLLSRLGWALLLALQIPKWQLTLARRAIAASVALEILSLGMQAGRSAFGLAGHSFVDSSLALLTNSMVMVNTAIVCGMLALFCANRVRSAMADGPMVAAIRYSIVIFLAGNAIGGDTLARGSHTVGTADGGPGLSLVHWRTIGGDLRIAHFISIHAIQIVPLFAYILSQMAPIPAVKHRRMAIGALALAVSAAVGATFVQAAMGRPLIPWVR